MYIGTQGVLIQKLVKKLLTGKERKRIQGKECSYLWKKGFNSHNFEEQMTEVVNRRSKTQKRNGNVSDIETEVDIAKPDLMTSIGGRSSMSRLPWRVLGK